MDLRAAQRPLKDQSSATPETARISLRARSTAMDTPLTCSIDVGRQVQLAGAHPAVGRAAEGYLDLRGPLGVPRKARVGFERLRLRFDIGDVEATAEMLERLPSIATTWHTPA